MNTKNIEMSQKKKKKIILVNIGYLLVENKL